MKARIKILILLLVCVSVILMGCVKKDYGVISEPGFNQDILKEKSLNIEKQTTFTEFKVELEDFKSFSDELFSIWSDHINRTSSMLDYFNSSNVFEEKLKHSQMLEQKYLEFKVDLENIRPPSIALQANNLAIKAVSYRILFFKKFSENATIGELNEIENQAYLAETGFWEEIDKVYKYFDEAIVRLDVEDDYKYIALNN